LNIQTKYFGEMEVSESDVINFPGGVFGFEGMKRFVIASFDDEDDGVLCLQ